MTIPRVLLTNDDGIDAPGMAVLEQIAAELAAEVWVVAPEHDQSGTSHSISLHAPLRVSRRGERRFGVSGTPGDSVVMALSHLMPEPPDLVLSGVNRGANLGMETVFSGTVGAALTAVLLGVPAIALSQGFASRPTVPWDTGRTHAPGVIRAILAAKLGGLFCCNVNFPPVPPDQAKPATLTRQGLGFIEGIDVETRTDPRTENYHWLRFRRGRPQNAPDAEAAVIAAGGISVTPLQFERTDEAALAQLRAAWG